MSSSGSCRLRKPPPTPCPVDHRRVGKLSPCLAHPTPIHIVEDPPHRRVVAHSHVTDGTVRHGVGAGQECALVEGEELTRNAQCSNGAADRCPASAQAG
jgi:hypothetical protein